jgi:hypothetical protein
MNDFDDFSEELKNAVDAGEIKIDVRSRVAAIIIEATHDLSLDMKTSATDFVSQLENSLKLRAELKNLGYALTSSNE